MIGIESIVRNPKLRKAFEAITEKLRLRELGIVETPEPPQRVTIKKRKPELPAEKRTPMSWWKTVTSGIDLGQKVFSKKKNKAYPVHLNRNKSIIEHYDRLRSGRRSWLEHAWTKKKLKSHCCNESTWFFRYFSG